MMILNGMNRLVITTKSTALLSAQLSSSSSLSRKAVQRNLSLFYSTIQNRPNNAKNGVIHSTTITAASSSTAALSTKATSATNATKSLVLYQYQICPFCNKVKALLQYAGLNHDIVEVNPLTKSELKWSKDYRKVPIAKFRNSDHDGDDEQINGSDEIIKALLTNPSIVSKLEERWDTTTSKGMTMEEFAMSNEEVHKWTTFANDDLAPILYPNICRSLSESYDAFGYVENVKSFSMGQKIMIRGVGSLAMYFAASKIKAKRNIKDERQALHDAISRWEKEGLDMGNKTFSSGMSSPNLGDLAVFGTLHSVQGLEAHKDVILKEEGGVIQEWYKRMEHEVLA